jgi:multidrug resistance efflux pump
MVRSVRGPGTLIPERVRWIAAVTGGRVEAIHVQPGDEVHPETVLIELANPDVQLETLDAYRQLAQAEAELANLNSTLTTQRLNQEGAVAAARTAFREAERQAEAAGELAERNLIARLELESRRDVAVEAEERLRVAEEQLEVMETSISARIQVQEAQVQRLRSIVQFQEDRSASMRVRAGVTGVVQELTLQMGQWVTPGTTLTRVVEPGRLNALLRIPETQVRDVAVGQRAVIDTRNGLADGRVIRIEPSVQSGSVQVEVVIEGDLPAGARPDLSVDGTIEVDRLEDVLHVGRPGYVQPESQSRVWKLEPDGATAAAVPVRFGLASLNTIEVVDGLAVGDRIIVSDMSRWSDVDRVRIR